MVHLEPGISLPGVVPCGDVRGTGAGAVAGAGAKQGSPGEEPEPAPRSEPAPEPMCGAVCMLRLYPAGTRPCLSLHVRRRICSYLFCFLWSCVVFVHTMRSARVCVAIVEDVLPVVEEKREEVIKRYFLRVWKAWTRAGRLAAENAKDCEKDRCMQS